MIHGFDINDVVPFKETTTMRPISSAFTDVELIEDIKPIRGKPIQKIIAAPASKPLKNDIPFLKPLADQALKSDIKPIRRMTTFIPQKSSTAKTSLEASKVKTSNKILRQKFNDSLSMLGGLEEFIQTDKIFFLSTKVESDNFHQFEYAKSQEMKIHDNK